MLDGEHEWVKAKDSVTSWSCERCGIVITVPLGEAPDPNEKVWFDGCDDIAVKAVMET
jgi:hypothetical protein